MTQRGRKVPEQQLIEYIERAPEREGRPVVATREIAEAVGLTTEAVRKRLLRVIEERDDVHRYKVGQSVVYWADGAGKRCRDDYPKSSK